MVRVVDASVAIKWFVTEPGSERALAVLGQVMDKPAGFAVPELFFFELAHVFHRVLPKATAAQRELLTQLTRLGIGRFSMTDELLDRIHKLQAAGLSGYDGAYVALAQSLGGKWLTFDAKACARVRQSGFVELLA